MWMLKKVWYRIFQVGLTLGCFVLPWSQPELLKGIDSLKRLPSFVLSKGVNNVLIVTDKVILGLGILDVFLKELKQENIAYTIYDGVEPNPSIESIEMARRIYAEHGCNGFIAIGGGSAMDCAKAAAARIAKPNKSVSQMGGLFKVLKKLPPIFAVPTTAGTGSETTIAAIVTDKKERHKYALYDLSLIPPYAVLDPMLTVGLPPHITATTGMDALTHCIESYLCCMNNPKSAQRNAFEGIKLIFENLEKVYQNGEDIPAREHMLKASFLGGCAFTRSGVGTVHVIAHALGGLYNTPHGLANAVILPHVLTAYGSAIHPKLAQIADLVGIGTPADNDGEKSLALIQEIKAMNQRMEIPETFDFIMEEDISQIIRWAMKECNPVYPVPVIFNETQYRNIIIGLQKERKPHEADL